MTDARFQDGGEEPLRLVAQDADDLKVLSSLVQDALLTHQDFLGCDALILAFPLIEETRQRYTVSWNVLNYAQMDRERLNHQFLVYGRALKNVLAALDEEASEA